MSGISELDYSHTQRVWKAFSIKNLGEYHNLYLKTDMLLLANIFEAFRNLHLRIYELDPANFYTAPGLAFQVALKFTGVELELLTGLNMFLMLECRIRGGLVQVVHCLAKANNKYTDRTFNP